MPRKRWAPSTLKESFALRQIKADPFTAHKSSRVVACIFGWLRAQNWSALRETSFALRGQPSRQLLPPPSRKRGRPTKLSEAQARVFDHQRDELKARFRSWRRSRPMGDTAQLKKHEQQLRNDGFSDPVVSLVKRGKPAEAANLHLAMTTKTSRSTIAHKIGKDRGRVMTLKTWARSHGFAPHALDPLESLSAEDLRQLTELVLSPPTPPFKP